MLIYHQIMDYRHLINWHKHFIKTNKKMLKILLKITLNFLFAKIKNIITNKNKKNKYFKRLIYLIIIRK
jgi:hypothetical protein